MAAISSSRTNGVKSGIVVSSAEFLGLELPADMKKPAGLAGFLCFNFGKGEIELSASDRSSHADSRRRE
jgi:hypothetical protein